LNREFGDFQTPPQLVAAVLESLCSFGKVWPRVIEPTCGRGNFLAGLLKQTIPPREIQAVEIQDIHLKNAQRIAGGSSSTRITIRQANLFHLDLHRDLQWSETGSLLVVGNPPWVTNSELGTLESDNLPNKTNIKGLRGIEARTGGSNFDIAEYIWLKLIKELAPEQPTIALLCKTSVARNVLQFAFEANLPITSASIRKIDAKKWFGAAVEACLFCIEIGPGERHYEAAVYESLYAIEPESTIGIVGNQLVADMKAYQQLATAGGTSPITWRQGLKHDAASVMELTYDDAGNLRNKLGEAIIVEADYLYPLLKSSDLFHYGKLRLQRAVIVTQQRLGENTYLLKQAAPQLWNYLTVHSNIFEQRKSSIYDGQPPFAIFGIGNYSFAPYKVAISGLHKIPRFRAIGPVDGRPVMLDDTCYFIPCYTAHQAAFLTSLFNNPLCLDFINSMTFLGSKRPITKKLLQRIDLRSLFNAVERQSFISNANTEFERLGGTLSQQDVVWPSLEEFLIEYSLHTSPTIEPSTTRQTLSAT
jgi:hypothetical protein